MSKSSTIPEPAAAIRILPLSTLLQDIRYGFRVLRKSPSFTAVAVLTLALGIGANTAMFSVVSAVVWRSLPSKDPDRIVFFDVGDDAHGGFDDDISIADFADWKARDHLFEQMAAFRGFPPGSTLTGEGIEPEQVSGDFITSNWLSTMGWKVWMGREFLPEEEQPGHDNVLILSHQRWPAPVERAPAPEIVGHCGFRKS